MHQECNWPHTNQTIPSKACYNKDCFQILSTEMSVFYVRVLEQCLSNLLTSHYNCFDLVPKALIFGGCCFSSANHRIGWYRHVIFDSFLMRMVTKSGPSDPRESVIEKKLSGHLKCF